MKKILLLLLFLFCTARIYPQLQYDTLLSYKAGPGINYTKIRIPSAPWMVNVLEIDLKNPAVKLETAKGNDVLNGATEVVPSVAVRKNSDGHFVIGAVNGDFFSGPNPLQMQVLNGEILKRERTDGAYASIAFNLNREVEFVSPKFSGSVSLNGKSFQITGVNESRPADKLVMYNSLFGTSTNTMAGIEVLLHPTGEWFVNDTVSCVVDSISITSGNLNIPKGCIVLSGSGLAGNFLIAEMHKGDVVKVFTKATDKLKKLKELIGGHPFIMKNGAIAPIDPNDPMLYQRNPRTIIGINNDTTKMFVLTVDGRQTTSVGMTVWEVVDFLKSVGVFEAMNFDGGGSTTMAVRTKLVNVPSEGAILRPVGNTFMIVSTLHAGNLNKVTICPRKERIYKGEKLKYEIFGSDSSFSPVELNPAFLQYSVSKDLGVIDNSGNFTAGDNPGKGYVYVKYINIIDSAFVEVKTINKINISPKNAVVDLKKTLNIKPKGFDIDGIERTVAQDNLQWKSTNTSVAQVDSLGNVSGKSEGKTKIIANFSSSIADTAEITVQVGKGTQILGSFDDKTVWTVAGQNIDTANTKISISIDSKSEGSGSLKINYRFTYDPAKANFVYLNTSMPVYGIPDSLFIDTKSDSTAHKLSFVFSDDNDELFRINAYGYINNPDKFVTIPAPLKNFAALGSGIFYYPVKLTRIEIQLQYNNSRRVAGQTYSGTIYLDNMKLKYPDNTSAVDKLQNTVIHGFNLSQNYPNPFNPVTVINYSLPQSSYVRLRVFDILGNEVVSLVNEEKQAGNYSAKFDGTNLSTGVYFYRIEAGSYTDTKKLLLLK